MTRVTRCLVLLATALTTTGLALALASAPASAATRARPVLGHVDKPVPSGAGVRVSGWAIDRSHRRHRLHLRITVDGQTRRRLTTTVDRPGVAKKYHAARRIGFTAGVHTGYGTHTVCVWSTSPAALVSCSRVTVTKPSTAPGHRVAALAARQVGKRYVEGAAGPSAFDCSGLVSWVYAEAVGRKLPHNAQTQADLFHAIPARRAQAGDLVFFHDGGGYVYHVGILAARHGWMYAAATPQDGVRYQAIWSSAVTYGTLLHT